MAARWSPVVTLSLSARIVVNAEALNMAESVGNVSRHRRAPVIASMPSGYSVFYVPAVSGEAIAHHYQRLLAGIAQEMGLPVTSMDKQGFFLKFSDDEVISRHYPEVADVVKINDPCEAEKTLVKASVVADVAGFLYTDKLIKRTSRIRFSYMLPTLDAVEKGAVASSPQLHVRYSPEAREGEQALYYVESGSSLYSLSAVLVASSIAELEYCTAPDAALRSEKPRRVEAALKALLALIDGMSFGAKRSRYMPQWEVKSLVASVSAGPVEFIASPAARKDYGEKTVRRAQTLSEEFDFEEPIEVFVFDSENIPLPEYKHIKRFDSHTEAIAKAIEKVLDLI